MAWLGQRKISRAGKRYGAESGGVLLRRLASQPQAAVSLPPWQPAARRLGNEQSLLGFQKAWAARAFLARKVLLTFGPLPFFYLRLEELSMRDRDGPDSPAAGSASHESNRTNGVSKAAPARARVAAHRSGGNPQPDDCRVTVAWNCRGLGRRRRKPSDRSPPGLGISCDPLTR